MPVATSNGSAQPDFFNNCTFFPDFIRFGVWFSYTPTDDCILQITESTAQDVRMVVFGGSCGSLSAVTCATNENTTAPLIGGQPYWILLGYQPTSGAPGVAMSVTVDCLAPLANDACDDATVITSLPFSDTIDNKRAGSDQDVSCNISSGTNVWNAVWYTYTPTMNCTASLNESSSQNVVMSVYTGFDCLSLTEYFCTGADTGDSVDLYHDTQYWILIGLDSSSSPTIPTSSLGFTLDCTTLPTGDSCASADVIASLPYSNAIDNSTFVAGAPGAQCDQASGSPPTMLRDAWLIYTATSDCTAIISVDPPTAYNAVVQVWAGADCQSKTIVACTDASTGAGTPEFVNVAFTNGQTYWIQFGRSGTGTGAGGSTLVDIQCIPAPANDLPCNATVIPSLPFFDNVDAFSATHDVWMNDPTADSSNFCGTTTPQQTYYGVWYTYTPPHDCTILVQDFGGTDVNSGVFTGSCGFLNQVACTGFSGDIMSVPLSANVQYWILVGSYGLSQQPNPPTSNYDLSFECREPPPNDFPCTAVDLNSTGLPYFESVDISGATDDPIMLTLSSCHAPASQNAPYGVWYEYQPETDCTLTLFESSSQNAAIAIYEGFDCNSYGELTCTGNESISYGLTGGLHYWVLVSLGTVSPALTTLDPLIITIDCSQPPVNDQICGAIDITSTPYSNTQSLTLATDDIDIACNTATGTQVTQKGVWYSYTPTSDCMALISETSSLDIAIGVFQGSLCNSNFELTCSSVDHVGIPLFANETYWFLIGLQTTTPTVPTAAMSFTFDCVPLDPPANDMPCGATVIGSLPYVASPVIATATNDIDVSGDCNLVEPGEVFYGTWYQYTPASNCSVFLGESSINNVVWGIFTGDPDCNTLVEAFCDNIDSAGPFSLTGGTTYYILVGLEYAGTVAPYSPPNTPGLALSLAIDCINVPANDTCLTATQIPAVPYTDSYNNLLATDGLPIGSCNSTSATDMDKDVWYSWTASSTCDVTVNVVDTAIPYQYGQIAAVYAGPDCDNLSPVQCSYSSGITHQFPFVLNAQAGTTYWFQLGRRYLASGTNGGPTTLTLTGDCESACLTCPADMSGDSELDGEDVQRFTECVILANNGAPTSTCECADVMVDSLVDANDITAFVNLLLQDTPSCP
ncbi:MAG: hypothetical protein IPK83_07895 [Planctomycetes bacterium]|nr:hypothetical protein [Planctomycetota bacterium]